MAEHFTGNPQRLFDYWQDEKRAKKFLTGGTRGSAIEFCRAFKDHFHQKVWVDIGTGTGYVVKKLIEDYKPRQTIGIDISKAMLKNYQLKESLLTLGSGFNIPLRNQSVDAISTFFCFSDYPNLQPLFQEAKRTLTPKGKFLFVDYAKGDGYWERRRKHHGEKGIIGNINLRTIEEIQNEAGKQFETIHASYVQTEVDTEYLNAPFELPQKIKRRFVVIFAEKAMYEER